MNVFGKILIILALLLAIIFIGSGIMLVTYKGKKLPVIDQVVTVPFLETPPVEVLSAAIENFPYPEDARYDIDIRFRFNAKENSWGVHSDITYDGSLGDKPVGSMIVQNDIEIGGLSFLLSGEGIFTETAWFYKINELPAIPYFDMTAVQSKWFKQLVPDRDTNGQPITDGFSPDMVTFAERLPDETIDDAPVYHYILKLNARDVGTKLRTLYPWSSRIQGISDDEIASWEIDLWIGKGGSRIVKLDAEYSTESVIVVMSLSIKKLSSSVKVVSPQGSKSVRDMIDQLFSATSLIEVPLYANLVGLDPALYIEDSDKDDLYIIWERFFSTDPTKSDTDGDGFLDGEEVRSGYNPNGKGKILNSLKWTDEL